MKTKKLYHPIEQIAKSILLIVGYILFMAGSCTGDMLLDLGLGGKKPVGENTFEGMSTDGHFISTTTGQLDDRNRWQGSVTIEISHHEAPENVLTESVEMEHGKRNGTGYYQGKNRWGDDVDETKCWIMGKRDYDCDGIMSEGEKASGQSAFQILYEKYYWYLFSLYASGFDDEYMQGYLDTLEAELASFEFGESEFYDYYDNVVEGLRETPYDSVITTNEIKAVHIAHTESLNSEFRLAVFDRYTTDSDNLFAIFQTKYPGYLRYLNENEVSNQDFETYCLDFENRMAGFDPISQDEPLFLDSLDWRMCQVVIAIGDEEEKSLPDLFSHKTNILQTLKYLIHALSSKTPNADITTLIFVDMYKFAVEGEILAQSVKEAWLMNQGIASVATVATDYTALNTVTGHVFDNGGAAVTERGIAWTTSFNPTIDDNAEISGSGTGSFSVTLQGLTDGVTYFARAYAINSVDTAYGNCVEFVAGELVGFDENGLSAETISLYPNPLSKTGLLKLRISSSNAVILTILNLKGQEVFKKNLGKIALEEQEINIDLSEIIEGLYICNLSTGDTVISKKLYIAR